MKASATRHHPPIVITRNRVPRITLIKRQAGREVLRDAVMFFAGASFTVFVALMGLAIAVWHPFR